MTNHEIWHLFWQLLIIIHSHLTLLNKTQNIIKIFLPLLLIFYFVSPYKEIDNLYPLKVTKLFVSLFQNNHK